MPRFIEFKFLKTLAILFCILFIKASSVIAVEKRKEILVIATNTENLLFDPRFANKETNLNILDILHCSLLRFDENNRLVPQIAEDLANWRTPVQLEIKMKKNILFSDGSRVTPQDVKATYDYLSRKSDHQDYTKTSEIKKITVENESTLLFELKSPNSFFFTVLTNGILPEKQANSTQPVEPKSVIGCGPYIYKSQDPGKVMLESNTFYSFGKKPTIKKINLVNINNIENSFEALKKGEIDLVQNSEVLHGLSDNVRKTPNIEIKKTTSLKTNYIGFNLRNNITGNIIVRKAIAHAIDRKAIIDYVLDGFAIPAKTLLTPNSIYANRQLQTLDFNIKKANRQMKEAGFEYNKKNGSKLTLTYKTFADAKNLQIGKAIAAQLSKIGIKITVIPIEAKNFFKEVSVRNTQLWGYSIDKIATPDIYGQILSTKSFPPNGDNFGFYANFELDNLLEEAISTLDEGKKHPIYLRIQDIINSDLPLIFLWHEEIISASSNRLKGYRPYPNGYIAPITEAYLE
ncbi:MAG: ABC transporter substrate-binding protein [Oligoflexales bacterium]|nr:ABC transporter substrate-binding protein [Oligoflexales bacterium]